MDAADGCLSLGTVHTCSCLSFLIFICLSGVAQPWPPFLVSGFINLGSLLDTSQCGLPKANQHAGLPVSPAPLISVLSGRPGDFSWSLPFPHLLTCIPSDLVVLSSQPLFTQWNSSCVGPADLHSRLLTAVALRLNSFPHGSHFSVRIKGLAVSVTHQSLSLTSPRPHPSDCPAAGRLGPIQVHSGPAFLDVPCDKSPDSHCRCPLWVFLCVLLPRPQAEGLDFSLLWAL